MPYLAVALVSPINSTSEKVLWSHMLQHVLIADIAPGLLLLGLRAPILPLGLPRGALKVVARKGAAGVVLSFLLNPWVVLPLWMVCQWVWAIPAVFEAAAYNPALHVFEHATLFYSGLFLWWIIIDPLPSERRRTRGGLCGRCLRGSARARGRGRSWAPQAGVKPRRAIIIVLTKIITQLPDWSSIS